jgi:hypothetical protein
MTTPRGAGGQEHVHDEHTHQTAVIQPHGDRESYSRHSRGTLVTRSAFLSTASSSCRGLHAPCLLPTPSRHPCDFVGVVSSGTLQGIARARARWYPLHASMSLLLNEGDCGTQAVEAPAHGRGHPACNRHEAIAIAGVRELLQKTAPRK